MKIVTHNKRQWILSLKKVLTCGAVFLLVSGFVPQAQAVNFSFINTKAQVEVGQVFTLTLYADTLGVDINALEGTVIYPKDNFTLTSINTSSSIISLWAVMPKKVDTGSVAFSGAIPGGYTGSRGEIMKLTFKAIKAGVPQVTVSNLRSVKNDGLATVVSSSVSAKLISIQAKPTKAIVLNDVTLTAPQAPDTTALATNQEIDTDPPEPFTLYVSKNPSMYNGKWFTLANVIDKGSSLAGFYIYESRQELSDEEAQEIIKKEGKFVEELPAVLDDQSRKSYVYVGAYDDSGNLRLEAVPPLQAFSKLPLSLIIIIIFTIAFAYVLGVRRSQNQNSIPPSAVV